MDVVLAKRHGLRCGSEEVGCETWRHGVGRATFAVDRAEELKIVEVELSRQVEREVEVCGFDSECGDGRVSQKGCSEAKTVGEPGLYIPS